METNVEQYSKYIHDTDRTIAQARILSAATEHNVVIMEEYNLDCVWSDTIGHAIVKQADSTVIELEFNVESTVKVMRKFAGEAGTHQWKIFKPFQKEGAYDLKEGDHVVVLGTMKDRVIMEDPSHSITLPKSVRIRTHLIPREHFFAQDMHSTPESH